MQIVCSIVGWLFVALLIAAVTLGLRNVFGDVPGLEKQARAVVCGADARCDATLRAYQKSALSVDFTFAKGKGTAGVRCAREWYFVGDYRCVAHEPFLK